MALATASGMGTSARRAVADLDRMGSPRAVDHRATAEKFANWSWIDRRGHDDDLEIGPCARPE